jgi:hypothetical protein
LHYQPQRADVSRALGWFFGRLVCDSSRDLQLGSRRLIRWLKLCTFTKLRRLHGASSPAESRVIGGLPGEVVQTNPAG